MIEVFDQEIKDGIILSNFPNIVAYNLDIAKLDNIELAQIDKFSSIANLSQPDLFYMDSILVTLGWNLNDDIFLKEEVYPARETPVDKPFNKMHNQDEIIGHMTSSRLLNSDYKVVSNDDFEHIAVSSVIYKAWRDEQKQDEVETLIAQILDNKWKVSMECLFDKFDYGIITADGKQQIIKRTPETSYLTKYLRAYKGNGVVNNNRIGRVLRNITFCGKGLVDNPGNPYSIIFNKNNKFLEAKAANIKEFSMNELELAKAELDKVKAELISLREDAQKSAIASYETTLAEKDEVIKSHEKTIAGLREDVKTIGQTLTDTQANLKSVETLKVETVTALETVKAELNKIKLESIVSARKTALKEVVAAEKVDEYITKFSEASPAIFNELISALSMSKADKMAKCDTDEDEDEADAKKKAKAVAEADLKKAELDKEIPLHSEAGNINQKTFDEVVNHMLSMTSNKPLAGSK